MIWFFVFDNNSIFVDYDRFVIGNSIVDYFNYYGVYLKIEDDVMVL